MATYYRCDGVVSIVGNGNNQGLKCSTEWVQVDEPVYTLISIEQGRELFLGFAMLFTVIAIYRALGRIG